MTATKPARNGPINCGLATTQDFPLSWKKLSIRDRQFASQVQLSRRETVPGTASLVTVDDAIFSREVGATYQTDYIANPIAISETIGTAPVSFAVRSLDAGVLSDPDSAGLMSYVSDGEVSIVTTSNSGESFIDRVAVAELSDQTVETFAEYASGSLAANISEEINGRATTADTSTYLPGFLRNAGMWAGDIDWSCVSAFNSATNGAAMGGTLISPRHVLFCRHFGFYPRQGASIKFVGPAGQQWDATIQATTENTGAVIADFAVALLGSEAPEYISFAKVLPSDWRDYLPTVKNSSVLAQSWEPKQGSELPVAYFTQDRTVNAMEWLQCLVAGGFGFPQQSIFAMSRPQGNLSALYQPIRLGDSGQPIFCVINNTPVVLSVFTTGFTGTFVSDNISVLNTMMSTLGGGYQLTPIDLSAFPTY
jgi:hypothetical protein